MANLFPVFDVPEVVEGSIEKQKYNPSVYFDFEKGDFVRDGAHGMVMHASLGRGDRGAVESAVERTITEALMVNPKTEYVRGFEFEWMNEDLSVSFVVKGKEFDEQKLRTSMGR